MDHTNPDYYQLQNGAEVIDITGELTFCAGNAVKYLARAGRIDGVHKEDRVLDLEKARWYVDREIQRLEADSEVQYIDFPDLEGA